MEAGQITFPHKKHATCIFTHQAFFAEIGQNCFQQTQNAPLKVSDVQTLHPALIG